MRPEPRKAPEVKQVWPRFEASQHYSFSTDEWFVSQGHYAGTSLGRVRVSPDALVAYRNHTRGAELPVGTTLVMLHKSRSSGKLGRVHAMQKHAQGWNYYLLEKDGGVIEEGQLPRCARCHAEAVSDSVFGPPEPVPATQPQKPLDTQGE